MADTYAIKMPKLSDTMTEGTIVTWEKNVGDNIARGTVVATVETDKAIMDVEVFREGHLSGPLAPVGAVVPVGGAIAYLVAGAKDVKRGGAAAGKAAWGGRAPRRERGGGPRPDRPGRRGPRPPPAPEKFDPYGTAKPKTHIPAMP